MKSRLVSGLSTGFISGSTGLGVDFKSLASLTFLREPVLLGSPRFADLFLEILLTALQEFQLFLHQVGAVHLGLLLFELVELKSQRTYRIGVMTESLPEPQEQQGEHG